MAHRKEPARCQAPFVVAETILLLIARTWYTSRGHERCSLVSYRTTVGSCKGQAIRLSVQGQSYGHGNQLGDSLCLGKLKIKGKTFLFLK